MKISTNWIKEILQSDLDPHATAHKLTMSGTESEEVEHTAAPPSNIIVADVIETIDHPSSDRKELKIVKIWDGKERLQVVCGAPNTPGEGAKVVFAGVGSEIKGVRLEQREFNGIASAGMLCSEDEIGIGPIEDGIIVLDEDVKAGTPLREAFELEDWILDLSITPNRPDLLGHMGAAREIAVLHGIPFREPDVPEDFDELPDKASDLAAITILDPEGCPRYTGAVVRGVTIGQSPLKIRNRLHNLGVRPISNVVDVTNWILLLHNQPLHAFDLKQLSGATIIVRKADDKERIITLDGVDRELCGDDLVIADKSSPVALAGIMGGEGSQIEKITKDLLIECAYFSPQTIRKTSARLKLSSESSYRFERGIDPTSQINSLKDSVAMICRLTGGKAARGLIDAHPSPHKPPAVGLRSARVEKILGAKFDWNENLDILEKLGCKITLDMHDQRQAMIGIPPFRPDISREIDLIEEIARIRGYDKIPSSRPVISVSSPERGNYDLVRKIRYALAAGGFTEAVNLSIVGSEKQKKYFPSLEPVVVANPITSERDTMRLSLLPGLLDNLVNALNWKEKSVRLFEVGTVFSKGEGGLVEGIVEQTGVAAVAFGDRPGWIGEKRGEADFYDVLGLLRHFADAVWQSEVKIERPAEDKDKPAFLLPASACRILIGDSPCGWIGELHPELFQWLELPQGKSGRGKAGVFELSIPGIRAEARKFRAMPAYPSVERDIAMVFDERLAASAMLETIRKEGGDLLESAEVFDIYRGKGIEKGKKSLAFSLVFRSPDATLTTEEVDPIYDKIIDRLEKEHGGKLR